MKILLLTLIFVLSSCSYQDNEKHSYPIEKIFYSSKNIFGFENIFGENLYTQDDVEIFGVLHFPENYDPSRKYPLVIASHGSYNWRSHHLKYLEQIRLADFIVFAMHPFDSRNVKSTVGNQINVTSETVIYDMAISLNLLWEDPRIDNQKVYAAGWSLGGTATPVSYTHLTLPTTYGV